MTRGDKRSGRLPVRVSVQQCFQELAIVWRSGFWKGPGTDWLNDKMLARLALEWQKSNDEDLQCWLRGAVC